MDVFDAIRIANHFDDVRTNGIVVEQRARYLTDAVYHARVTIVKQAIVLAIDRALATHTIDPADTAMFAIAAVDALEAFDGQ